MEIDLSDGTEMMPFSGLLFEDLRDKRFFHSLVYDI